MDSNSLTPDSEDWQERKDDDTAFLNEFYLLLKELKSHCQSNIEFFKDDENEKSQRIFESFKVLDEHVNYGLEPNLGHFIHIYHKYDYDSSLPANGYRSFIKIVRKCCFKILTMARQISTNRESMLFRSGYYGRELYAYVTTLGQLRACIYYLNKLKNYCESSALFPDEDKMSQEDFLQAEKLLLEVETLSQEWFYGRCLGFQYCESMTKPLNGICLFMASFSDGYLSENSSTVMKVANSIVGGGRYAMDPELRGEKIVEVTRNCDIQFCKAFWAMNENDVMHTLPLFVCPPVEIDKVITLPPEPINMQSMDEREEIITITPPCSHHPEGPVSCRLISYELREGQENWKSHGAKPTHPNPVSVLERAPGLIIHIHGGGFVAQSSASHEVYLRHWAKQLHTPIFSIDYALAPDNPFPRGLEECFYAYCWAVKNYLTLGSKGERIVICGDSAGGNLAVAVAMKAAALGVRVPDGIQLTYACLMVRYSPSPSRMMSLMDPLLPMGILSRCLAAYAGMTEAVGVNAPMRGSITKQTLYEIDEKASSQESVTFENKATANGKKSSKKLPVSVHFKNFKNENLESVEEDALSNASVRKSDSMPHEVANNFLAQNVDTTATPNDSGFVDVEKTFTVTNNISAKVKPPRPANPPRRTVKRLERSVTIDDPFLSGTSVDPINENASIPNKDQSDLHKSSDAKITNDEKLIAKQDESSNYTKPTFSSQDSFAQSSVVKTIGFSIATATKLKKTFGDKVKNVEKKLVNSYTEQMASMSKSLSFNSGLNVSNQANTRDIEERSKSLDIQDHSITELCDYSNSDIPNMISLTEHTYIDDLSYAKLKQYAQSPTMQFKDLPAKMKRNPYMSPILATDDLLYGLPPIYFVCCHLDPLLDDSITFAKRLRNLGKEVYLDVLEELPHGFLNLILISKEAKEGSDLCVKRIQEILNGTED